jgi:uncharacterized membrane protein YdjX (TVP38/TMEM64 family)
MGSANLNNRSMGVDTECDLAIEADGDERVARAIATFRNRLLAEHLGSTPSHLAEALSSRGTLLEAVEELRNAERWLEPLEPELPEWIDSVTPTEEVIDPELPIAPEELLSEFVEEDAKQTARNPWLRAALALGVLLTLAATWRWTPLQEWLTVEQQLSQWAERVRGETLAPLAVVGTFLLGTLMMIPITLLIVVTALTFDTLPSFLYAVSGSLAGALVTFAIGRALGRDLVRRLSGSWVNRVSKRLSRSGMAAVVAARVLPLAPFTIVNLIAGASHIRWRDYALGSFLGLLPGVAAITLFESRLENALRNPGVGSVAGTLLVLAVVVAGFIGLRRYFADEGRNLQPGGDAAA